MIFRRYTRNVEIIWKLRRDATKNTRQRRRIFNFRPNFPTEITIAAVIDIFLSGIQGGLIRRVFFLLLQVRV